MIESEFIITEPKIPFANRIIFALAFSAFIVLVIYIFRGILFTKLSESNKTEVIVYLVLLFGILVRYFLPLLSKESIHLNFSELKIKRNYSLGIFNYSGKWRKLEKLNYISVFRTENGYEVNIWYKKNKILNLFALEDFNEVIEEAFLLSEKLNIDLLDARKRGYHKWINKSVYKETGKIKYID